jgi:hypothetical protein
MDTCFFRSEKYIKLVDLHIYLNTVNCFIYSGQGSGEINDYLFIIFIIINFFYESTIKELFLLMKFFRTRSLIVRI